MKKFNWIKAWLLPWVTLGIYSLCMWYTVAKNSNEMAEKYGITKTGVAAAWILRHPAGIQLISGTMNPERLRHICQATTVTLSRADWYALYRAAGHSLP